MTIGPGQRELLPIACTIGAAEGPQRLREWQEVAAVAGIGRTTTEGKVTLIFRDLAGVREDLERLVAAERLCCGFLDWRLVPAEGRLQVEVTGTDEALRALPPSW